MPVKAKNRGRKPPGRDIFGRGGHARCLRKRRVYHVISRIAGNMFLLRPDIESKLEKLMVGVLAQARIAFEGIEHYASAALSNHTHDLLSPVSCDPRALSDYIGFIKREISRRWRSEVGWETGSMWCEFECTALVTPQAQLNALRYVLQQGVKENLVEDPRDWPGLHCAKSLTTGKPLVGHWFNGTAYGKKLHREKAKHNGRPVVREDFYEKREFRFDPLPALSNLSKDEYRQHMVELVEDIVEEGKRQRNGRSVLGIEAICSMNPKESRPVPPAPWFEERKRMIVWDDKRVPEVREYLALYWDFQLAFRSAAIAWKDVGVRALTQFPEHAFIPGLHRHSHPPP